jgi:transcriptional regulator with XRE-family HTH domain
MMARRDPNSIDVHVGNRVRMRRQLIGMSQEKLGELLGITFQQVQKYEKASNRISASRLHHVAQILGVPVQYFFEDLPMSGEANGLREDGPETAMAHMMGSSDMLHHVKALNEISDPKQRKLATSIVRLIADSQS